MAKRPEDRFANAYSMVDALSRALTEAAIRGQRPFPTRKYADQEFAFDFVYAREAHPGENYPALHSFEQKLSHAKAFRQIMDIQRPTLVNDLEDTAHRMYGMLPNMTYTISSTGKVLFRSD